MRDVKLEEMGLVSGGTVIPPSTAEILQQLKVAAQTVKATVVTNAVITKVAPALTGPLAYGGAAIATVVGAVVGVLVPTKLDDPDIGPTGAVTIEDIPDTNEVGR